VTSQVIRINLTGTANLEVVAKGGSRNGILAGSALSGVDFPDTMSVAITGLNGTAIPRGVRIYSQRDGAPYLDLRTFPGRPNFLTTATLRRDAQTNEVIADVTVTNAGPGEARGVQLTSATLNDAATTTVSPTIGRLIPELPVGRATRTLRFPASAGLSGAGVVLKVHGVYQGGKFGGDIQMTLP
jgi:hypothetical protein